MGKNHIFCRYHELLSHETFVNIPRLFFLHCFCLNTSSNQPTGSLNFSRVQEVKIHSQSRAIIDPIYAVKLQYSQG
jgi:hypothetical protein